MLQETSACCKTLLNLITHVPLSNKSRSMEDCACGHASDVISQSFTPLLLDFGCWACGVVDHERSWGRRWTLRDVGATHIIVHKHTFAGKHELFLGLGDDFRSMYISCEHHTNIASRQLAGGAAYTGSCVVCGHAYWPPLMFAATQFQSGLEDIQVSPFLCFCRLGCCCNTLLATRPF